ncbi:MFS transporter [Methylobacterium oryzae CBMB20]
MWSCLYAYTPELYPTRARATGAGFASAFGRIGAILGPMIVPVLVRDHGPAAAFQVGAGGFLIAALLVLTLGVETRGKVLEAVSHRGGDRPDTARFALETHEQCPSWTCAAGRPSCTGSSAPSPARRNSASPAG